MMAPCLPTTVLSECIKRSSLPLAFAEQKLMTRIPCADKYCMYCRQAAAMLP